MNRYVRTLGKTEKYCYKCKKVKSVTLYNKNKYRHDKLQSWCKECQNKFGQPAVKEWCKKDRKANPQKYQIYSARFRDKKGFDGLRNQVFKRDGNQCVLCGSKEDLCIHHKIYKNVMENLITICRSCHTKLHFKKISLTK